MLEFCGVGFGTWGFGWIPECGILWIEGEEKTERGVLYRESIL